MKNIFIIGYFGEENNQIDGQTIKTRNIYNLLRNKTSNEISYYDTQKFQNKKLSLIQLIVGVLKSDLIVYLPGKNNLKKLFPIIQFFNVLKKVPILHIAVGGWLNEFLVENQSYVKKLAKFQQILVESKSLQNSLIKDFGFSNVSLLANFRIHDFRPNFSKVNQQFPLKIVFMARITKSKGLEAIFSFAEFAIQQKMSITIDFYGPMDNKCEEYFFSSINNYDFITYNGVVEPTDVFSTLSVYDVLVLPTFYEGEGFPGTIVDSYIAGIPVVVSNWKFLPEFVDNSSTGFVYDLDNEKEFYYSIKKLYDDSDLLNKMKLKAHVKSKEYSADSAWEVLEKFIR